jgi:hypothetical protein
MDEIDKLLANLDLTLASPTLQSLPMETAIDDLEALQDLELE